MASMIAMLLIGPWLIVLGGLYWLYVRKAHANPAMAHRDVALLAAAFAAAVVGAILAWQAASGHGSPIWKFVAGPIGAYAGFCVVLLYGLVRHHRQARRRAGA